MDTSGSPDVSSSVEDDHLVELARRGRRDAAETLVRRYLARVYGLARRMLESVHDAEDATQETMVKAMRALHRYRTVGTFDRWVLKIASNTCLTMLRSRRRMRPVEHLDPEYPDPSSDSAELDDRLAAIERLLAQLPDRQRAAFVLFHYQGWSTRRVAETLEIPEATVRSSLHRARNRIRGLMASEKEGCTR